MEDSLIFHQYHLNSLDSSIDCLSFQDFEQSYYPQNPDHARSFYIGASQAGCERPAKQQKSNIWNSCNNEINPDVPSSSCQIISFGDLKSSQASLQKVYGLEHVTNQKKAAGSRGNFNLSPMISQGSYNLAEHVQDPKRVGSMTETHSHAQDHVIAERKRREKLNERLVALSALIPELKKNDKASVLGDAIKYVKQLQERVKMLEEQAAKKTMESFIVVRKSQLCTGDEASLSDENFNSQSDQYLPEIEARVSDRDVLIRIYCENRKGCIENILNEIEKLQLTVVNSNVMSFGNSTLDITVVAQMDVQLEMNARDLVKNLRPALLKFM